VKKDPRVTVHGLRQLELRELKHMLCDKGAVEETEALHSGQQGDAAVYNLIASATPWVAGVIGLWLLKPRKGSTKRRKLTLVDEAGNVRSEEISTHVYSSESPSDTVVNALSKLFGLGTDAIREAIGATKEASGQTDQKTG
jgi:hypothetical protein